MLNISTYFCCCHFRVNTVEQNTAFIAVESVADQLPPNFVIRELVQNDTDIISVQTCLIDAYSRIA